MSDGSTTIALSGAAAGVGIALYLVGGAAYCAVNNEECFPDEEALQARLETYVQAQARFTAGLRRYQARDPEGLALICLSAHDGYSTAQYFYGSHLLGHEPGRREEAIAWLRLAAGQGHRMADLLLRWEAGQSGLSLDGSKPDAPTFATPSCASQQG